MNFKRFHESKNLFDEDNIVDGGAYYPSVARGRMISSNNTAICLLPCKPNTAYTVSRSTAITKRFAMCFLASNEIYDDMPIINGIEANTGLIMTSTSTSNSRYLCFYYAKTSGSDSSTQAEINAQFAEIMINEGAEPLPYEPYGDTWVDTPHYIHNTSTDTLTTLPADIYANDTAATVGLKGDMVQSGTPSPTTPIQPSECGDMTGNLFDKSVLSTGEYLQEDGGIFTFATAGYWGISDYIPVIQGNYIASGLSKGGSGTYCCVYDNNKSFVRSVAISANTSVNFTIGSGESYVRLSVRRQQNEFETAMFNQGSTALPYEPYGIKIPILNNSQTTNVYLGEVQSTRNIKKLVLDGTETWSKGNYPPSGGYQFFTSKPSDIADNTDWLTTHFKKGSGLNGSAFASYLSLYPEASILPENATINDFKAWLAAQYDAGTPVTIWYILAEPETAVVNEPLRKIGDYADEVSGISIPTIAGANTLSVDTTLQPSEVTATYKGWHPVQSVHEAENGQWD